MVDLFLFLGFPNGHLLGKKNEKKPADLETPFLQTHLKTGDIQISQYSPCIHFQSMFYGCRHRCEPCGFSLTSGITQRSAWWFYQHFSRLFMSFHAWLVGLQPSIPRDVQIVQDPLKNLWFSIRPREEEEELQRVGAAQRGFFWDLHRHGSHSRSFHFNFSIKLLKTQGHPT